MFLSLCLMLLNIGCAIINYENHLFLSGLNVGMAIMMFGDLIAEMLAPKK